MGAVLLKSVLIVDDDAVTVRAFGREFMRRGWRVYNADSCASAATAARRHRPGLIVLDLRLRDGSALDVLGVLRAEVPAARVVVTTGFASVGTAVSAMKLGAHHYVEKPCTVEGLIAAAETEPRAAAPPLPPSHASLAQSERVYIEHMIAACSGNISEAARRLGVHRRSLQRKLRKNVPELRAR
jgi:two-component system response regulator RegA